ncbi:hypothetical protein DD563_02845 [Pelagicola sp. LXJ1103]|nr:hypothetical protein DD563_02845 [Pelagicola sp. LXJ1103]
MTEFIKPTWKNVWADVYCTSHPRTIIEFLESVVRPAIGKLEEDADMFKESSYPIDAFRHSDTQDFIAETLKAFCLSLNSIWERQLRNLMTGVARELYDDPGLIKKCQMDPWHKLDGLFEELRGFKLSAFKAYDDLDTLQLLANVCRHGDGPSLQRLSTKCPELWPVPNNNMTALLDMPEPNNFRTDNILISLELLETLSCAIQMFWAQSDYVYLESIGHKHDTVLKRLKELRPIWSGQFRF